MFWYVLAHSAGAHSKSSKQKNLSKQRMSNLKVVKSKISIDERGFNQDKCHRFKGKTSQFFFVSIVGAMY